MSWQTALAAAPGAPGAPMSREVEQIARLIMARGAPMQAAEIRRATGVSNATIGGRLCVARARGWLEGGPGRAWDVTDKARAAVAARHDA